MPVGSRKLTVLGLMSGTSMDGLDCGLFDIELDRDYSFHWECRDFQTFPYNSKVKSNIRAALSGDYLRGKIADSLLGQVFGVFVEKFLDGRKVELIGSHGQTIFHKDGIATWQVGDPAFLYELTNTPIVFDFRTADLAAGGNGAPLMPFLDWLIFRNSSQDTITLNIGGISNVTYIPPGGRRDMVCGFDTGPGMALIDECARLRYNRNMDLNGEFSRKGKIIRSILSDLLQHPFISKSPPKSSGRQEFSKEIITEILAKHPECDTSDIIRTLVAFTAKSISINIENHLNFNASKSRIIVSGGGVNHPVLMEDLHKYCPVSEIYSSQEINIDPDMKESLLISALAAAHVQKLTANMTGVTGADKYVVLGKLFKGK